VSDEEDLAEMYDAMDEDFSDTCRDCEHFSAPDAETRDGETDQPFSCELGKPLTPPKWSTEFGGSIGHGDYPPACPEWKQA